MDKSFHYLLMVTQTLFQKKVFTSLVDTNLTIGQPKVLDYLSHHNGSIQKDIAKLFKSKIGFIEKIFDGKVTENCANN